MDAQRTARIEIPPSTDGVEKQPKTERLAPDDSAKTVYISPESESALEEPKRDDLFDQYTVLSKIGSGGMGIVYLARDKRLGRFVAIKRLNRAAQSNPSLRKRFLHEARAVATLSHVHIVHIYALGEDADGPFIVMEYVAGPEDTLVRKGSEAGGLVNPNPPLTLDQYVARHGSLSAEEASEIILKIARAVAYAHTCGVIHRDLKPSNILLDRSAEPKIVDFGLARLQRADESQLTVPGEKLLSLGYGAPEQESDASHTDERSDVYGLGALLYFTLTGQNPRYFREQDIPASLRELVVKALATDKDQRWRTAAAFAEALAQTRSKTRIETPTVKTTWRCKWCDAVNPLTTKYCSECGWDGSEACPECGAQTFVGIQYCSNCGADARSYETVRQLLGKMRDDAAQHRHDRVLSSAGRVHGFEPAGPSGRKYLQEVSSLRDNAEKSIARLDQLKEQIPIELNAENYERAEKFIKEYRSITEEKNAWNEELRRIPLLIADRDAKRARAAVAKGDWETARRILLELRGSAGENHPDALAALRSLRSHKRRRKTVRFVFCLFAVSLLYLLSLPLAAWVGKPPFHPGTLAFYRPAVAVYRSASKRGLPFLRRYVQTALPNGVDVETYIGAFDAPVSGLLPKKLELPEDVRQKKFEYIKQLRQIESEGKDFAKAWPSEYQSELETVMERHRSAGDFEGWAVVQSEYKRFRETLELPAESSGAETASDLTLLAGKYRQILADQKLGQSRKLVTLCKKYVNDLTDVQRALTQKGDMEAATAVNEEIRRARNTPEQTAAEEAIASATSTVGGETEPAPAAYLPTSVKEQAQEIAQMREKFEQSVLAISQENAKRSESWPDVYLAQLNELMESCQRAGDYSAWENTRMEITRFEADRSLSARNVSQYTSGLGEIQRKFISEQEDIRRLKAESICNATEGYVKELQELQKKLTIDGNMESASAVNSEIRRVKSRVDYLEAQNELNPVGPPERQSITLTNAAPRSAN